jgi:hypothetical protein
MSLDPNRMYVICMEMRYGANSFVTAVEYRHFPPSHKSLNDQFECDVKIWNESPYYVISMPCDFKSRAQEIAAELGMKIVNGRPLLLTGRTSTKEYFPHLPDADNVFTLENRKRPVLQSAPWSNENDIQIAIIEQAERILNADFSAAKQMIISRPA